MAPAAQRMPGDGGHPPEDASGRARGRSRNPHARGDCLIYLFLRVFFIAKLEPLPQKRAPNSGITLSPLCDPILGFHRPIPIQEICSWAAPRCGLPACLVCQNLPSWFGLCFLFGRELSHGLLASRPLALIWSFKPPPTVCLNLVQVNDSEIL